MPTLSASGASQVEVYRGANSVLYGSDALGSVIQVTTRRGSATGSGVQLCGRRREFRYSLRQDASLGGVFRQFDYFADFMDFQTQNSLPNSTFHNSTFPETSAGGRTKATDVRFTIRHTATGLGVPNALALYGIA